MKSRKNQEENLNIDKLDVLLNEKGIKESIVSNDCGDTIIAPAIISTGSFIFDGLLGGGYRSCSWSRFYAEPEHGKSAQGLSWGREWQNYWKNKDKNYQVVVFDAEGRITELLIQRSGIDTDKNVFRRIRINKADIIWDIIERLVLNNDEEIKYFFIIDSTDACNRLVDQGKSYSEAEKIGGTATVLSSAGKRLSLYFAAGEHHLYFTSQLREGPNKGKGSSGGNAPKFYSSLTGHILKHWSDFGIFENPSDKKSKEIGRLSQIKLEKTYNETSGTILLIPIKYGKIGGIWTEYEAYQSAVSWDLLKDKGSGRFEFSEHFADKISQDGIKFDLKFHGIKNLINHLEENQDLTLYIFKTIRDLRGF